MFCFHGGVYDPLLMSTRSSSPACTTKGGGALGSTHKGGRGGGPALGPMLKSLHSELNGEGGSRPQDPPPLDPHLVDDWSVLVRQIIRYILPIYLTYVSLPFDVRQEQWLGGQGPLNCRTSASNNWKGENTYSGFWPEPPSPHVPCTSGCTRFSINHQPICVYVYGGLIWWIRPMDRGMPIENTHPHPYGAIDVSGVVIR